MQTIPVKLNELESFLRPLLKLPEHNTSAEDEPAKALMPLYIEESTQPSRIIPIIDQHYLQQSEDELEEAPRLGGAYGLQLVVKVLRKVVPTDDEEHAEVMLRIAKLKKLVMRNV